MHAAEGTDPRRRVPRTDAVLADPRLVEAAGRIGRPRVKRAVADVLDAVRAGELPPERAADEALRRLPLTATSVRRVINATGVVVHTNLGRAPLTLPAQEAMLQAAGYVDVEFDLETGARAQRGRGALDALRRAVPAAEDVLVVNNGAAALLLATTALAAGRELVISRGEMVEIGDGFRLPDLIRSTGALLREVGTTNRVTVADYADALGPQTGAVLKVHPSNFRIAGFAASAAVAELAALPVPLVVDVGSGLLGPDPDLPDEPDVASTLGAGADLVTCSGDKLLGGPQAGLIFGRADLVARLRRFPLARALRVDKLTLAALEATIEGPPSAVTLFRRADAGELHRRCAAVAEAVGGTVVASAGAVGGGGAPGVELPGWAVALGEGLAVRLRRGDPPVIGRLSGGQCLLDLRCVPAADDADLIKAVLAAGA